MYENGKDICKLEDLVGLRWINRDLAASYETIGFVDGEDSIFPKRVGT